MTVDHDRDFIDSAVVADAHRAARRVSLLGTLIVLVLGIGLIGLLMYGRILNDNGVIELTAPPTVIIPQAAPKSP
ncbi:MAG: hypothetical protein QM780_13200 [Hyphomicrobium sp.]|uniref:hypothetical protein n=1 Tax=Hyphomicrobium sp. TaxID=82 RepID=UPI0039E675A0